MSESGGVAVSIADTGKCIKPKEVEQIFNPLFTTKPNGMGWACLSAALSSNPTLETCWCCRTRRRASSFKWSCTQARPCRLHRPDEEG